MTFESGREYSNDKRSVPPSEGAIGACFLGATVFLASPVVAILAAQIWGHSDRSSGAILLHVWLARVAVGPPLLLAAFGIWLGLRSFRRCRKAERSTGLSLAGLLLSSTALLSWILAAVALLNTTESLLQLSK